MKNKKKIKNFRSCCLTKEYLQKSELVRVTKLNNDIFINDENIKGRSVYFLLSEAKNININKLLNIIKSRLKLEMNDNIKTKIQNILK